MHNKFTIGYLGIFSVHKSATVCSVSIRERYLTYAMMKTIPNLTFSSSGLFRADAIKFKILAKRQRLRNIIRTFQFQAIIHRFESERNWFAITNLIQTFWLRKKSKCEVSQAKLYSFLWLFYCSFLCKNTNKNKYHYNCLVKEIFGL